MTRIFSAPLGNSTTSSSSSFSAFCMALIWARMTAQTFSFCAGAGAAAAGSLAGEVADKRACWASCLVKSANAMGSPLHKFHAAILGSSRLVPVRSNGGQRAVAVGSKAVGRHAIGGSQRFEDCVRALARQVHVHLEFA